MYKRTQGAAILKTGSEENRKKKEEKEHAAEKGEHIRAPIVRRSN